MLNKEWLLLQLFAEGGDGGEAADTGETSADAGHKTLLELGVPADKLRNRAKKDSRAAAGEGRMTWEQVKADPEYSGKMQEMVKARLQSAKQAGEDLERLAPAIRTLARSYGLDPESPDYEALAHAVGNDRRFAPRPRDAGLRQHFDSLVQQGKTMMEKYPDFDLQRELQNPAFVRLTAPRMGVSVEDAYHTIHRRRLERDAAERSARQISNAIRSGALRPEENGTSAAAPTVTAFDYRSASRQQREALKQAIRLASARGEKLYPGEYGQA